MVYTNIPGCHCEKIMAPKVVIQPFSRETANDDKDAIEHSNDA